MVATPPRLRTALYRRRRWTRWRRGPGVSASRDGESLGSRVTKQRRPRLTRSQHDPRPLLPRRRRAGALEVPADVVALEQHRVVCQSLVFLAQHPAPPMEARPWGRASTAVFNHDVKRCVLAGESSTGVIHGHNVVGIGGILQRHDHCRPVHKWGTRNLRFLKENRVLRQALTKGWTKPHRRPRRMTTR